MRAGANVSCIQGFFTLNQYCARLLTYILITDKGPSIKDVHKSSSLSKADVWFGEMRTSAKFWGFATKFDINFDKLLRFDIAIRFQCKLDFHQCQL